MDGRSKRSPAADRCPNMMRSRYIFGVAAAADLMLGWPQEISGNLSIVDFVARALRSWPEVAMKYARLRDYLQDLTTDVWEASFDEIERILGFSLPASARRYQAWWANQQTGGPSQAHSWSEAGWRTRRLRIQDERVTFERVAGPSQNRCLEQREATAPSPDEQSARLTPDLEQGQTSNKIAKDDVDLPVIALVSCVKSKSARPMKAEDLYLSPLFQKSREYVKRHGWRWYILSALYGLVDPEAVIKPYDHTLNNIGRSDRKKWSSGVMEALDDVLPERARIILLAGERYSEFIVPDLVERGYRVDQPLKGLQLGRRLQFLGDLDASGDMTPLTGIGSQLNQPFSVDRLSVLQREHYQVANEIEGFFDRAGFCELYHRLYPDRKEGSILPSDYCFNRENKGNVRHPRFLWWDGDRSYIFAGLNGAPKGPETASVEYNSGTTSPGSTGIRTENTAGPASAAVDSLVVDIDRARRLATLLQHAFRPSGGGIFGEHQMPEDILPNGISVGSREQLLFVTFTVSVDYMRDASELWRSARDAWADTNTRYLFEPRDVVAADYQRVERDLKAAALSRKSRRDALSWYTIAKTLATKWNGDPRFFLEDCDFHAPTILSRLRRDDHDEGNRRRPDFPLLKGKKIGPLWVRMLRDNVGIELTGLADVPIPVDVHVLRATVCSGVIHGRYAGSLEPIFEQVRRVWQDATLGQTLPDGRSMVALDVDEALWTLSRLGCSRRGNGQLGVCRPGCPASTGCVDGVILIQENRCEIDTGIGAVRR
jgi:hypothetical protein